MKAYQDKTLSFKERAAALTAEMTLDEKVTQVSNYSLPVPRLGLKGYDYWAEASHGFFGPVELKEMNVTSYPVCLAMSQSWDPDKVRKVTEKISDEIRALHNTKGIELHMFCPTINMARDPRNGRSDENFGEDPFLAGKLAAAYIKGIQEGDSTYIKVAATPKHYAMNSSEYNRHIGNACVDEATIREYYAKVFEHAVRESKPESIMTAYNRVNGVPCSVNDFLLTTLLREEWGFDGVVVSDCGAVGDCYKNPIAAKMTGMSHGYCKSLEEASAMSLTAGTDVTLGPEHKRALKAAVEKGYISEAVIDRAIIRSITSRMRLGLFDEENTDARPFAGYTEKDIASDEMAEMSVSMARDSIVLLRNDKELLPINTKKVKKILVVGPNAIYRQLGGYSAGDCPCVDTIVNIMALEGIRKEAKQYGIEVNYEKGWCIQSEFADTGVMHFIPELDPEDIMMDVNPRAYELETDQPYNIFTDASKAEKRHIPADPDFAGDNEALFERAIQAAKEADMVIVIAGTDNDTASEEHDRETLALPYGQDEKIQRLIETNANTVVVLTALGSVTGAFFEKAHTILNAHFAGQAQGEAIADILFGKANPNAKLTATWYKNEADLPMIGDYGLKPQDTMNGMARTYMYFNKEVLFPFGFGLSYTRYKYDNLKVDKDIYDANETMKLSVDVTNIGSMAGKEIVEIYISKKTEAKKWDNKPIRQLKGFAKVELAPGETKTVEIDIPLKEITFWSNRLKKMIVEPGEYCVEAGGCSTDLSCRKNIVIEGEWKAALCNVYADASKYILRQGEQAALEVSVTKEDASHLAKGQYNVMYTTSNENIARVTEDGIIEASGKGTALITVTAELDGVRKSYQIPVVVKG